MPSTRRLKVTGFLVVLTVLIVLYITNGASNTYNSPFYTRTVEAIQNRHSAAERESIIAEEKVRLDRVAKIQQEHDAALSAAATAGDAKNVNDAQRAVGAGLDKDKTKPVVDDVKEVAGKVADKIAEGAEKIQDAVHGEAQKPVAGRKMMSDGKVVVNEKATDDGVAKVGNTAKKESSVVKDEEGPETEEDHMVEEELNSILKKGPVIIFSKTFCPYSKKAKQILLNLYSITPPPYVVELDIHKLGPGLQKALLKTTGRRTVPNILINGKSIGGGDDVQALHEQGTLIEKFQAMGGKRIMEIKAAETKKEMRFRG